jgi:RNA polymerase sigma-70 factor (ECF subfamily)
MIEDHKKNLEPELLLEEQSDYVMGKIFEAEVLREIHQSIETLPPQCKRVLRLTLQGMTTEDIAHTMGLSQQTVRNTKTRATEMLRKKLSSNTAVMGLLLALTLFTLA